MSERIICLTLLGFLGYSFFGFFIGLLLGCDRPTEKRGHGTFSIISSLIAFAGGSILSIYNNDTVYFLIWLLGFSIGAIPAYILGKLFMEFIIYPREHVRSRP